MAIYLPQQKSFMDQFLGTGVMNNVMQAMMMRMQNQRADKEYAQGLQEKGYTEIQDPSTYKADEYIDTTPKTLPMPRQTGPQQWVPPQKPDVTVGGGRGLMGTPKRGFKRPVEPKMTFGVEQGARKQDWAIVRKGNEIVKASLIKTKAPKEADQWEQLTPIKAGDSLLYPQRNKATNKIEYFKTPQKGKGGRAAPQPRAMVEYVDPDGNVHSLPNNVQPPKGYVRRKNERMSKKDIVNAETQILESPEDPTIKPTVKFFNENSNASYYYKWAVTPGRFFGTNEKVEKVPLPVYQEHQITLEDVRQTAKEEKITFDEAIQRAFQLGKTQ